MPKKQKRPISKSPRVNRFAGVNLAKKYAIFSSKVDRKKLSPGQFKLVSTLLGASEYKFELIAELVSKAYPETSITSAHVSSVNREFRFRTPVESQAIGKRIRGLEARLVNQFGGEILNAIRERLRTEDKSIKQIAKEVGVDPDIVSRVQKEYGDRQDVYAVARKARSETQKRVKDEEILHLLEAKQIVKGKIGYQFSQQDIRDMTFASTRRISRLAKGIRSSGINKRAETIPHKGILSKPRVLARQYLEETLLGLEEIILRLKRSDERAGVVRGRERYVRFIRNAGKELGLAILPKTRKARTRKAREEFRQLLVQSTKKNVTLARLLRKKRKYLPDKYLREFFEEWLFQNEFDINMARVKLGMLNNAETRKYLMGVRKKALADTSIARASAELQSKKGRLLRKRK